MTTEKSHQSIGDFGDDFVSLRDDIAKLTATVTELARSQAASATSTVVGAVDQARQKVSDTADDAQNRVKWAAGELEASNERNPLTAVVVALVAGFVVGLFTRAAR
jgi:ElaB/YqjD/DUF883 family membrane-anchored ribosome-binding protein